jgi:hypothetical protein
MSTPLAPVIEMQSLPARTVLLTRGLAWLCGLAAVGSVVIALPFARVIWLESELMPWAQAFLLAGWVLSIALLIWGLWNGRASFVGLARGEPFARRTIAGLRNLALGILLFKILSTVTVVGLALAQVSPHASITFKDLFDGAFTLVSLGAIVVIASVLTRAAAIVEDNAQIV